MSTLDLEQCQRLIVDALVHQFGLPRSEAVAHEIAGRGPVPQWRSWSLFGSSVTCYCSGDGIRWDAHVIPGVGRGRWEAFVLKASQLSDRGKS
jgi:hypothetical protein